MKTIQIFILTLFLFTSFSFVSNSNNINNHSGKLILIKTHLNKITGRDSAACTKPASPMLNGSPLACLNLKADYSISPVAGATSYVWSVKGGTITYHNFSNTYVEVRWFSTAQYISVEAVNSCGSSPASKIIITVIAPHCGP